MVGAQFSRVRPSKNQSRDRLRTTTARENVKNRFRRRLRRHFFGRGRVFGRFLGSGRVPQRAQNRYFDSDGQPSEREFFRSCSASLSGDVLGPFWEAPGTLRGPSRRISGGIPEDFFSRKYVAKTTAKILRDTLGEPTSARKPMLEDCAKNQEQTTRRNAGQAIRRASHLGVRRSRASVLNSPYPNGVLAWF